MNIQMWDLESTKWRCVAWSITIPGKWVRITSQVPVSEAGHVLGDFWVSVFGMFRIRLKSSDTKGAQRPLQANQSCGIPILRLWFASGLCENWVPPNLIYYNFPMKTHISAQRHLMMQATSKRSHHGEVASRSPDRGMTRESYGKLGLPGLLVGFWLICLVNFGSLPSTAWLKIQFGQEMARAYL